MSKKYANDKCAMEISGGEFRSLENANDQYNCGFAVMPSFGGDVKPSVPCLRKKHGYLSRGEGHVPVPCQKAKESPHSRVWWSGWLSIRGYVVPSEPCLGSF